MFKVELQKLNDEIKGKNEQIAFLEKQIADSIVASHNKMNKLEISQVSSASFINKYYSQVPPIDSLPLHSFLFNFLCCSQFLNW